MRVGSLFSGYGGLDLGVVEALGGVAAWHCDVDPGAAAILAHRYPDVPNMGDVTAVDWSAVEPVDVLTGGFPCQDVSAAGKRAGIRPGTRSGLWAHFAFAIEELRPSLVVIENVRGLLSAAASHPAHGDVEPCPWCMGDRAGVPLRALGAVLGELADIGYDAQWAGLRAADVGAPHSRFRVFVVARPAPDAERSGRGRGTGALGTGRRPQLADGGTDAPPDATGDGRDKRRPESAGIERGPHAAFGRRDAAPDAHCDGLPSVGRLDSVQCDADGRSRAPIAWGDFEPAVRRWERCLGRPAPAPTEPGRAGAPRLSPRFVEWMMGLPAGWVTDVPGLSRNAQLKALGNGVVPQQAAAAVRLLTEENAA